MDKDRVLASIRVAEAYCYDAGGANAARNCKEARTAVAEVYARVERLEAENERMENLLASGVHSCSAYCERPICVMRRERDAAISDLAALRARVESGE